MNIVRDIFSEGIIYRSLILQDKGINPLLAFKQARAEHALRESAFNRGMGGKADNEAYKRGEIKSKPMNFYSDYCQ